MKNLLFILALSLAFMYSCTQDEAVNSTLKAPAGINPATKVVSHKINVEKIRLLVEANNARLALIDKPVGTRSSAIKVPSDYATIQEAVDAASPGDNIFVYTGTYDELVFVSTAGLNLQAIGNVQLNGGFFLAEGTDHVKIQKFNIDLTTSGLITGCGIFVFGGVTGVQIVQNNFTGDNSQGAYAGIDALAVSNMMIRDNHFSAAVDLGIHIISWNEFPNDGICRNNTILQNTVSGTLAIGLSIEGDTDFTQINGNTVNDNPGFIGIWICGCEEEAPFVGFCDNNVVKNNTGSYNDGSLYGFSAGFYIQEGGEGNTIGPNNTFNNNMFGIYVYATEHPFYFFNNTALENSECDIAHEMADEQNYEHNNTYDCLTSF